MSKKRICVIGAGSAGLPAIKSCLEEDFDVICYEKTDTVGGLWRYRPETDGIGRTSMSTVNNSSKEMNAYSDFPIDKEFANYMHNTEMIQYFEDYAKHFDLLSNIKFCHSVVKVVKSEDFNQTGKWKVYVRAENRTNDFDVEFVKIFDGVMVCTGHHSMPMRPTFQGQELFKGKIIHSKSFDCAEGYANKRVVVVGIGSSSSDIANELSFTCKQVYLSTRRGAWIWPRIGPKGVPADYHLYKRINFWITNFLPYNLVCWYLQTFYLNAHFDHDLYGVRPDVPCLSIHPTICDILPTRILSGRVIVKKNIEKFVENGVIFVGENQITECDEVVLGTGYQYRFPVLDNSILEQKDDNYLHLYKNVFPPHLSPHNTLAIIGAVQPNGAIFPIFEMQSRWYALVMAGKCQLPAKQRMIIETEVAKAKRDLVFKGSPRSAIQVMRTEYLDDIANAIGVYPDFKKYLWTDIALWRRLVFGTILSYQYRLDGPHCWSGARDAIMGADDRVRYPLNRRARKTRVLPKVFSYLLIAIVLCFSYLIYLTN